MKSLTSPFPVPQGHPALSESGPITDDNPASPATCTSSFTPTSKGLRRVYVVVLDRSGSMKDPWGNMNKLEGVKRAALGVLSDIFRREPGAEVLIVSFNAHATVVFPLRDLEEAYSEAIAAVKGIQVGGNTDQGAAMGLVEREVAGLLGGSASVMVLLMSDCKGGEPRPAAQRLKQGGALIAVSAFGTSRADVKEKLLREVASVHSGETLYRFADSAEELATTTKTFTQTMKNAT